MSFKRILGDPTENKDRFSIYMMIVQDFIRPKRPF